MGAFLIQTGIVARDQHGRVGIVLGPTDVPSEDWLAEQVNLTLERGPHETTWWHVMPLTGGLVIVPEEALEPLRAATYEDFLAAVDHANVAGRQALAQAFPEFVRRAAEELAKRREYP
jgi:hypothetical protein